MIVFNRRHYRVTPLNMQSFPDLSRDYLSFVLLLICTIVAYFLHHFRALSTQACVSFAKDCHATTKSC